MTMTMSLLMLGIRVELIRSVDTLFFPLHYEALASGIVSASVLFCLLTSIMLC